MRHSPLFSFSPPQSSPQALREVRRDTLLRRARTCYGHLAGVAGVSLMDRLIDNRWIEPSAAEPDAPRIYYALTAEGTMALERMGVAIPEPKNRKPVAFSCLDWTERRYHLGGALGRAIVDTLVFEGRISRVADSRVVELACDPEWLLGPSPRY